MANPIPVRQNTYRCYSRPARSASIETLPKWLTSPVARAFDNPLMPKLNRQIDGISNHNIGDDKSFFDWSGWVHSLLDRKLWRPPDGPMIQLIPDCRDARVAASSEKTVESYHDDAKVSLVRLMIREAGARALGVSSCKQLHCTQRAVFRATTSPHVRRERNKLTLIRIIDLCYVLNDIQEVHCFSALRLNIGEPQRHLVKSAQDLIDDLHKLTGGEVVKKIESIMESTSEMLSSYHSFITWDSSAPYALSCRNLCNRFPPLLPGTDGRTSKFHTREAVHHSFSKWVLRSVYSPEYVTVWLDVVTELSRAASNDCDIDELEKVSYFQGLRRGLSQVFVRTLLDSALVQVSEPDDLELIVAEQSERRGSRLTFRLALDLVTSLSYLSHYFYITQDSPDLRNMNNYYDKENPTSTFAMACAALTEGYTCFQSLVCDLSEFMHICNGNLNALWQHRSAQDLVQLSFRLLTAISRTTKRGRDEDRFRQLLKLVNSAVVESPRKRVISPLRLPNFAERSVYPFAVARAFASFDPSMTLRILDDVFGISDSRTKRVICEYSNSSRELAANRSLSLYASLWREGSILPANDVSRLADTCLDKPQAEPSTGLFSATGAELSQLRHAANQNNGTAQFLYAGILIAEGKVQEGGLLTSIAIDSGQVAACPTFGQWKQYFPDATGPKSLTSVCKSNALIAELVGHFCRTRLFEIAFDRWLKSQARSDHGPNVQSIPAFCTNDETKGRITAEDAAISYCILLSSEFKILHKRSARILARMLHFGIGIPQNGREAELLYSAAVDSGSTTALMHLGSLHELGAPGIVPDGDIACLYYHRCAELAEKDGLDTEERRQLYAICHSLVANMHVTGRLVPRNVEQGVQLYSSLIDRIIHYKVLVCYIVVTYRHEHDGSVMEGCIRLEAENEADISSQMNPLIATMSTNYGLTESDLRGFCLGFPVAVDRYLGRRFRAMDEYTWWMS